MKLAYREVLSSMVKRENWNGAYWWVARDPQGRLLGKRKVSGSKLNREEANSLFKQNKTLFVGRVKNKRVNITETFYEEKTSFSKRTEKPLRKPRGKARYFVKGFFNGQEVWGASKGVDYGGDGIIYPNSGRQAKEEAWNNFLAQLSKANNEPYEVENGIRIIENGRVKNIVEGWIQW